MNDNSGANEEMINFPVPRRYFSVVVQALAKAMEAEAAGAGGTGDNTIDNGGQDNEHVPIDWSKVENCKKLRGEMRYAGALTMLDLAASRPNELVSFADVVQASGRGEKQVRADLGALTKAIKRGFDVSREEANWPVEFRWAAGGEEQAYYIMRPEIAQAWKQSAKQ